VDHSEQLRSFLAAVRRRWFAQEALTVAAHASALAAGAGLGALLLFWILAPEGPALVLLAAIAIAVAVGSAATIIWRMQRRPDDRHVARFVEERAATLPEGVRLDDAIVTAVDPRAALDPAFGPLLSAAAIERLQPIGPERIVPAAGLRRAGLQAGAGVLLLGVTLALAASPLRGAAEAAWLRFFPDVIQVDVTPGDARVVAGQPVRIRAIVRTGGRMLTRLVPSLRVVAGNAERTVAMAPNGDGFAFSFESVDRTFKYKVLAGPASSGEFTVTALFAPRVERIDLHYEYPSFTGLPPRKENDGGDIYAPAGTRVRVRIHTDKPVVSGEISLEGGAALPLEPTGDRVLDAELVLRRDDAYRVQLADADGLRARDGTAYFIRLMEDRPPDVRIMRPAGDQRITPLEEVTIEARAEDDYGISSFELVYSVPGGQARVVPFGRTTGTETSKLGAHLLAAEELRVKPGDVITYYARARDVGRGKRPTETRSDMYFLEVRPFGEEFVAAQSQAGGGAGSAQIESLIAAQKEIINATWNVERRTGAGRSARDVEDIAQAQAELKARVEQMTSRRRGRFDMPQQIVPRAQRPPSRGAGDPVAGAIQSMSRAVEQLHGQRTREALPHEMAALQGLLQAQAEIRRREVLRQQANGASGSTGRQSEDLSALFDKELQRQQRTNYENRSQLEERPDETDRNSALDRIRDLARRQEELSRQQRELAEKRLTAEERKRQLERLTREQNELREQVEELAKQERGQSQQQASSKDGRGSQTTEQGDRKDQDAGGRGSQLKDASEQMRGAAQDLGREDAQSAAERAARAADQLRRLEEQIQGGSPEARQRAAGELQLEAQQIAEEQRRIASEARRLEKAGGPGDADARRRLAGEKDRLAERTDSLQRAADAMARNTSAEGKPGAQTPQMAEVARELEKQQLGQRMRETADRMREDAAGSAGSSPGRQEAESGAKPKNGMAEAEEQIARALDGIVDRFAPGAAETRQLTGQLDRTRGIRDRLNHLERKIAEAEAKEKAAQSSGGQGRKPGESDKPSALDRLRQEYGRELQQARETLNRLQQSAPRSGAAGTTPEQHEWSQADPGTQSYKQDYSGWQALRKDIDLALERTEVAAAARLAHRAAEDRLNAGGSDRVPDAYRRLIARYYESLARAKK
jgi:hypothetical protein